MRRHFVIVGFALVAACGARRSGDDGLSSPIQGGEVDVGDPAVGIVRYVNGHFCTGTLVAPDVVLTAGHCVENPVEGFYLGAGAPSAYGLRSSSLAGMQRVAAAAQKKYPGYTKFLRCPNPALDVGLVKLAAPVSGVAPLPMADAPPSLGTTCRAVGFGMHTDGGAAVDAAVAAADAGEGADAGDGGDIGDVDYYGEKREADVTLESVDALTLGVRWGTGVSDHGDSGGPLLCGGVIAGTTSCHNDGRWPQHVAEAYARTDLAAAWVRDRVLVWDEPSDADPADAPATD